MRTEVHTIGKEPSCTSESVNKGFSAAKSNLYFSTHMEQQPPAINLSAPLKGDYKTCGMSAPFHVEERDGDLHFYVGSAFGKPQYYDGEGNPVIWGRDQVVTDSIKMLQIFGEMKLAPCRAETMPDADSFEAFLRSYSNHGNLASYFPPLLEKLGVAKVTKKGRALVIALAPGYTPQAA